MTISDAKDKNGVAVTQGFITDETAITSDMGLMVFREEVYEFTTDVVVKVWYSE